MRRRDRRRPGASLLELAGIMWVLMTFILGCIDLGMGILHYNQVSQAARRGTRKAIVHGALAPAGWDGGPWSPVAGSYPGQNPYKVYADGCPARVIANDTST